MLRLQDLAKQTQHSTKLILTEHLPSFLNGPCEVQTTYRVEAKDDYYLIHLHVKGELNVLCQRCMQEFKFDHDNSTVIAVCKNEDRAESLLEIYESIVSLNGQVVLEDLVRDELYLYVPQSHPNIEDCDEEVLQILT